VRLALPQPYEDLDHTADAGVRVRGETAEEALGRLALALADLLAGGGAVLEDAGEALVEVEGGPDLAGSAVALLRELLYRFATARTLPAAIEVVRVDAAGAAARVTSGRHDPARHAGGLELKAVTRHAARLAPEGGGWVAQAVFDV
jgi:SHS2 domain-containing protein